MVRRHLVAEHPGWWPILIAFGHSFLSMSGFETLAQVYREIASPKLKNLKITGQHRLHLRGDLHRPRSRCWPA